MRLSLLAFLIITAQTALALAAWWHSWGQIYQAIAVDFAPLMVIYTLASVLTKMSGEIPLLIFYGLAYGIVKYFLLSRALVLEEFNFFNLTALLLELAYFLFTSWLVVSNYILV